MDRAIRVTPRRADDGSIHFEWRHASAQLEPAQGGWRYRSATSGTEFFIPGDDEPALQFSARPLASVVVALLRDPVLAAPRSEATIWLALPLELRVFLARPGHETEPLAEIDVIDGGIRRAVFDQPRDGRILPAVVAEQLARPSEPHLEDQPFAAVQIKLKNRHARPAVIRRIPIDGEVLRLFREGGFIAATSVTVTILDGDRAEARSEAGRAPLGFRPVTMAATPEVPRPKHKRGRPQWLEELTRRAIEYSL
jgi:hypothetical protein